MERLTAELQRLYGLPHAPGQTGNGHGRALVIVFERPADWPSIAALSQALEDDLGLPAPALSVDGQGFRLWLALDAPLADADKAAFRNLLRERYLQSLPEAHWHLADEPILPLPPQQLGAAERWTAFIDPGMGALFAEDAWLDLPPGADRQADLLVPLRPLKPADMARLRREFSPPAKPNSRIVAVNPQNSPEIAGPFNDPRDFLRAVMNDPGVDLAQRIAAATALLANPASRN